MAEENFNSPESPEFTKQHGATARRNSTGRLNPSESGQKNLPNYLRASTGSCHDFCKYGGKHVVEAKARRPVLKRHTVPKKDGYDPVQVAVLPERKKTSAGKLKPLPDSKGRLPETPKTKKHVVSPPSTKAEVYSKQASPITGETNLSMKRAISSRPKAAVVNSAFSYVSPRNFSGERNSDVKVNKKTGTFKVAVEKALAPSAVTLSPKPSVKRVASIRKHRNLKVVSPLKDQKILNGLRKSETKKANKDEDKGRTFKNLKFESALKNHDRNRKPEFKHTENNNNEERALPAIKNPKVVSPLKSLNRNRKAEPRKSIKSLQIIKMEAEAKKSNNGKNEENSLHVLSMETESKILESVHYGSPTIELLASPSSLSSKSSSHQDSSSLSSLEEEEDEEESEFTDSEADGCLSENSEAANLNVVETLEGEYKRRPRKGGLVSVDNDCTPTKLKFRRGKVIDLLPESNGPRRLRFRQGKVLGGGQNGRDARKRSFKRREVVDGNNDDPDSRKVVLRHQDVQGKKDAQGLYNNVIEETASKLVETRKSKVKALVGAFETVISLQ